MYRARSLPLLAACLAGFAALPNARAQAPALDGGPLVFVENRGQWPEEVDFQTRRGPFTSWFHARGWTMALRQADGDRERGVAVRLVFEGSRAVAPTGAQRLPSETNYFLGNDPDRWVAGAAHFGRVRYEQLYDGIDVVVRSEGERPEYDLVVAPGADLGRVVIRCEGIDGLTVAGDGALVMANAHGDIRQTPPTTWYVLPDGTRRPVECRFRRIDDQHYGFALDAEQEALPLVVDPGFLWSTFLGGDGADDRVYAVQRSPSGEVVVAGSTDSTDFPTTLGAYSRTPGGERDAYVARFDPSQAGALQLVSCTLLGGSQDDWCYDVEVLGSGDIITMSGNTISPNFPTTANAYQAGLAGDRDGYYAELDLSQQGAAQLRYSTCIGGPGRDFVSAHEVRGGVVTLAGEAAEGFPVTPGAFQTTYGGGTSDVFVARLDPCRDPAHQLLSSTYLGGDGADGNRVDFVDRGVDLDLDEWGGAVLAGRTASTDFPTSRDAFQSTLRGDQDAFVARLDRDNEHLRYSTYFGGDNADALNDVHYDGWGVVSASGYTSGGDFPVSANAHQAAFGGGNSDMAVVRLDTRRCGTAALVYSTHLGGTAAAPATSTERARGLAVESSGAFVITGFVGSTDFPTTAGALLETPGGGPIDAVIARIDPQQPPADQLLYSSYLPGSGIDVAMALVLDGTGGVYVGGTTSSADFVITPGAFQDTVAAGRDGFVGQLDLLPAGVTDIGASTPSCHGPAYAGVTTQPRGGRPDLGMFNDNAPPFAFGMMLLGEPVPAGLPFGNATLFVDLGRPFTARPVLADGRGYAQVTMPQTQLPAGTVAFQFVWLNTIHCRGRDRLSASNALSF